MTKQSTAGGELTIGDPAPPLLLSEYVKGEPVGSCAKEGVIHVIEFWATWCMPCIESVPKLSAIQDENPDICVLGIAVRDSRSNVVDFVENQGDSIRYRVAIESDEHASKASGLVRSISGGDMYDAWLTASLSPGIPTAFIVGREGVIEWIGHPQKISEPLADVVAGTNDRERLKRERAVSIEQVKNKANYPAVKLARRIRLASGDPRVLLSIYDEEFEAIPELELQFWVGKLNCLTYIDAELAERYFRYVCIQLADRALRDPRRAMWKRDDVFSGIAAGIHMPRSNLAVSPMAARFALDALREHREEAAKESGTAESPVGSHVYLEAVATKAAGDTCTALKLARKAEEVLVAENDVRKGSLRDALQELICSLEQCNDLETGVESERLECNDGICEVRHRE